MNDHSEAERRLMSQLEVELGAAGRPFDPEFIADVAISRSVPARFRPILVAGTVVAAVAVTLAVINSVGPSPSPTNPSGASVASLRAQQIVADVLATQPNAVATAAAFVETTIAKYQALLPPESRLPDAQLGSPDDAILVVKIFGTFQAAHRGLPGVNTDATTILVVYNERLQQNVEVTYFSSPLTQDISATAAKSSKPIVVDLRQLGSPETLEP